MKRVLSLTIIFLLVTGLMSGAVYAVDNPFADVSSSAWYYTDVMTSVETGLVNGKTDNTFCPEENLTYAEAVKLASCMNQRYLTGIVSLSNGSPWYQSYVDYALTNGIISQEYDWNSFVSRADFMEIFAHALPVYALIEINDVPDGSIPDVSSSDPQAEEIYLLYRAGIVQGSDAAHSCCPESSIKRSEVAAILTRMMFLNSRIKFSISIPSGTVTDYDRAQIYAAKTLNDEEALVGGTYIATETDESVLEASGTVCASVTGTLLQKQSGNASSANDSSFKGVNAAVRVYGNADVTLKNCDIEADAQNATGVFAYDGGTVHISDSTVTVTGGGAGGVQVAGGGTLYGSNLTVSSASKAAIRSDRGGGTMVLDGGAYTSTGTNGCPAIYSTADITVRNAACSSEKSRAVIIEGKNAVTVENCTLIGNDQSTKEGSVRANVLLYQSASGDAKDGTSVFSMTGGKMVCKSGTMFYCTNTASEIHLTNAELELAQDGKLLTASAGRWGKEGKNGGNCSLYATDQILEGDILVDNISALTMSLSNTSFTGAISGEGTVNISMDAGSTWILTGDSRITSIEGDLSGLNLNGFRLFVNGVEYTQ